MTTCAECRDRAITGILNLIWWFVLLSFIPALVIVTALARIVWNMAG